MPATKEKIDSVPAETRTHSSRKLFPPAQLIKTYFHFALRAFKDVISEIMFVYTTAFLNFIQNIHGTFTFRINLNIIFSIGLVRYSIGCTSRIALVSYDKIVVYCIIPFNSINL